jgi:hypothetical protein
MQFGKQIQNRKYCHRSYVSISLDVLLILVLWDVMLYCCINNADVSKDRFAYTLATVPETEYCGTTIFRVDGSYNPNDIR